MMLNNSEDLKQSLIELSTVANRLDARSRQATQQIVTSTATLDQGVQRLEAGAARFANDVLRAISGQAQHVIAKGTEQAVDAFNQQLQQSTSSAKWAANAMAEQRQLLTTAQTTLVWKGLIALIIGSLLAVGGSGYVAWNNMREVKSAKFGQDILQATQTGKLTHCGDVLCVKLGKRLKRYDKDSQYVLLQE